MFFDLLDLIKRLRLQTLVGQKCAVAHQITELNFKIGDPCDKAECLAEDEHVVDEGQP